MSPLRWDVLLVGFVLALPVVGLYLHGDLDAEEMMNRVLWCLAAGWGAVALVRWATTPAPSAPPKRQAPVVMEAAAEDDVPSPATT